MEDRAPRTGEEDPKQTWAKVMQRLAADETATQHGMQLSQMRDDLTNYQWRNDVAYYQHAQWYERHSEELLYQGAAPLFSGKGAAGDHPATHKFFMESFHDQPELLQAYTRGTTKKSPPIDPRWNTYKAQPHLLQAHTLIK